MASKPFYIRWIRTGSLPYYPLQAVYNTWFNVDKDRDFVVLILDPDSELYFRHKVLSVTNLIIIIVIRCCQVPPSLGDSTYNTLSIDNLEFTL